MSQSGNRVEGVCRLAESQVMDSDRPEPRPRIFQRGLKDKRHTVNLSEVANQRVLEYAKSMDKKPAEAIGDMVEEFLVYLAERGRIDWPEGYDPKARRWKS